MKKVELLPTRDCEAGYGPAYKFYTPERQCDVCFLLMNILILKLFVLTQVDLAGIIIHKCEYTLGIYYILRFCPLNPPSGAAAQLPRAFPSQADHEIWLRSLRW